MREEMSRRRGVAPEPGEKGQVSVDEAMLLAMSLSVESAGVWLVGTVTCASVGNWWPSS
jgi:hypothetical protein